MDRGGYGNIIQEEKAYFATREEIEDILEPKCI